jgi:hypothetical protein
MLIIDAKKFYCDHLTLAVNYVIVAKGEVAKVITDGFMGRWIHGKKDSLID